MRCHVSTRITFSGLNWSSHRLKTTTQPPTSYQHQSNGFSVIEHCWIQLGCTMLRGGQTNSRLIFAPSIAENKRKADSTPYNVYQFWITVEFNTVERKCLDLLSESLKWKQNWWALLSSTGKVWKLQGNVWLIKNNESLQKKSRWQFLNVHRHSTFVPFHRRTINNYLNFFNVATYNFYFRIPLIERPLSKINKVLLKRVWSDARKLR